MTGMCTGISDATAVPNFTLIRFLSNHTLFMETECDTTCPKGRFVGLSTPIFSYFPFTVAVSLVYRVPVHCTTSHIFCCSFHVVVRQLMTQEERDHSISIGHSIDVSVEGVLLFNTCYDNSQVDHWIFSDLSSGHR